MYLGRFQQGDWVTIPVVCRDSSRSPILPTDGAGDSVPAWINIYDKNHRLVVRARAATPKNRLRAKGLLETEQRIGPEFLDEGLYTVLVEWSDGSYSATGADLHSFEVIPGGDPAGTYISLTFYRRPHANYVIGLTDGGLVDWRKNPYLE